MSNFNNLSSQELQEYKTKLMKRYHEFQLKNLTIDMTRGKPCPEQLDLSMDMLTCINAQDFQSEDGVDCRNYGGLDGILEAKKLFSTYLEVEPDEVIIGGNSSLTMMHDIILQAMIHGVAEGSVSWGKLSQVKFLCPCPGYDRHFSICEHLGIDMIPVEMKDYGPDISQVERLAAEDDAVRGIWCVPKYSNPTGVIYSDEVVDRLANMKTKAEDFRIFWDNAYAVHHLTDRPKKLKHILQACKKAGNPDRALIFGSTSKITFAGAGLAMMAGSKRNIDFAKKLMFFQTIGPDKLNQLRHVRFLKNMEGIESHMKKHAAILKPKFDMVLSILEKELDDKDIATWSQPAGGYFISVDTPDGCAEAVIKMAAKAGVKLTPEGSTFPYKKDPKDRNIRLAPTFPSLEDIQTAIEILTICIQLVSIENFDLSSFVTN
ncbi:MAG: aminotransferase class I/II-fold pyridoxal phosphate-dependent enzyme [Deltaproteobacteria bacterium]|nr:aminotransferase class I/II-fold pyridoxal phosphate-dependent enzyme [Deltaproteobacteria bacterium]MBW2084622.1 aminotransferase class I/II-fold pyridoxal phosphate-dependent enzyme [Deltaproteobacteria bacterium]